MFEFLIILKHFSDSAATPGGCKTNSDCDKWAPFCSDFGFCQWTEKFGSHPDDGSNKDLKDSSRIDQEADYADVLGFVKTGLTEVEVDDTNDYSYSEYYYDYEIKDESGRNDEGSIDFEDGLKKQDTSIDEAKILNLENIDSQEYYYYEYEATAENEKQVPSRISETSEPHSYQDSESLQDEEIGGKMFKVTEPLKSKQNDFNRKQSILLRKDNENQQSKIDEIFSTSRNRTSIQLHNEKYLQLLELMKFYDHTEKIFTMCPGRTLNSCVDACTPLDDNFVYVVCVQECTKRCP